MNNSQTSFQLSDNVDQNKVFLVNLSDIEGRIDPQYYFAKNRLELVNKTVYPVEKISHVLSMQRGRFGHRPRNDPAFYGGEYPFIQTGDIVKANLRKSKIGFNQTLNEKGLKTSRLFDEKVVVFTIAANIGYTAILDYPACFPDSLIAMKPKSENVLLEYINIYLSIIRKHIESLAPQAAQKNINYQQLSLIPFIIPPVEVQSSIVEINNRSVATYKTKIAKAQNLLNSVDDYLLTELDIKVPDVDSSLSNRIFTVQASELSGGRFDALQYKSLLKDLILTRKDVIVLSQIVLDMKSGIGAGKQDQSNEYEGIIQIRPTNISKGGKLNFTKNVYVNNIPNTLIVKKGDVLFNNTNSQELVGKTAYYDLDEVMSCSNHITRILVDHKKILPKYLGLLLNLYQQNKVFYYLCINWNNQSGVGQDILRKLPIVLPNISKQQEIVQHIDKVRATATQLQQEANEILAQAKQKIERMILGEEN